MAVASETLRSSVDQVVKAAWRIAATTAVVGTTAFADPKPQTPTPTAESTVVKLTQAIKDKDARTLTSMTDTTSFVWRVIGKKASGFTFGPKSVEQEFEKSFAKKTQEEDSGKNHIGYQPQCVAYTDKEQPSKMRVMINNFAASGLFENHRSTGSTWFELTKTNSGYKITSIGEYTFNEDDDYEGLIEDWSKMNLCPPEKKPSRRRLIYQTGLTTEIDTSGTAAGKSPTFQDFQIYSSSRLGYKGPDQINVTRKGWEILPDGRYKAGKLECGDTMEHPVLKAHNLVRLLLELNKQNPADDYVVLGHSEGGVVALLALQNIRFNLTRDPGFPLGPHNLHFIIAHSPVGGINETMVTAARGLIPGLCEFAGMPDTNSEAIKYLKERWNNQEEELSRIREDVSWWAEERIDKNGNKYRGRVEGLYNIADRIYAPQNLPRSRIRLTLLSIQRNLPREILTQVVPGARNKEFHLYDGLTNHGVIYTSREGKEYIGATIGEQRRG